MSLHTKEFSCIFPTLNNKESEYCDLKKSVS